ncbi:GIY-YIG nuclease family protein [Streptomyces sp. CBG30]|uniref:GIY-YIG nuclease family protein n=1 Tax=Streptomyces sp. CBG30 TaxID=2838869 RepID=UPI0027E4FB81|nr:GIY-YIG nuclease family protein [Streptomyces sp. CBG30]
MRSLIPPQRIGTYVLYGEDWSRQYVGRSDTDVRRRLLRHCSDRRADYFTYDVHHSDHQRIHGRGARCFHLLTPDASQLGFTRRGQRAPTSPAHLLPTPAACRPPKLHSCPPTSKWGPLRRKDRR